MAQRKTLDEQIELALAEREKKEERIKLLLARRRTKEDKARTHRLCKRGGLVESKLPRLAKLTDDQFDVWMKKTLLSGFAEKILNEIMPPPPVETEDGTDTADSEPASKHESVTPAPQNNGNNAPRPVGTDPTKLDSGKCTPDKRAKRLHPKKRTD